MKRILLIITITMAASVFANAQGGCNMLEFNLSGVNRYIESSLSNSFHIINDDLQVLILTPEVYKTNLATRLNCPASSWPSDWMKLIGPNYETLKKAVETDGTTRAWKERPFQRPTEQAIVKTKYLAKYPGVKILKIGSNYKDWNVFKNSLGIPTNRYVRGEILLQIPGRPYCQAQEWVIKQPYKGGGFGASVAENVGGAGYFVKCP